MSVSCKGAKQNSNSRNGNQKPGMAHFEFKFSLEYLTLIHPKQIEMNSQRHEPEILRNKFKLSFLPTPLHPLKNLSKKFSGYNLFIKRDDQSGLATGGNKARKLEYFIHDALTKKCDTVITAGAQQSNHCRQTAAACAMAGLKCHLVLGGGEPKIYEGNLLLSRLLGAVIRFSGNNRKGEDIPSVQFELESKGKVCYQIPYGGSNETGALGFVNAVKELKEQLKKINKQIDFIFLASSSGATLAGLMLGMRLFKLDSVLMPVNIDKERASDVSQEEKIFEILNNASVLLGMKCHFKQENIKLIRDYDLAGYEVVTENERSAIRTLASTEGILLDPVYTGRAFFGMLDQLDKGLIKRGSNILFWHTGGLVANGLFAKDLRISSD